MSWAQFGGSLAAILALTAIARLRRLDESRIDDPDRARAIAERLLVGFVGRRALASGDGRAALVAGNGTIAVLKRTGAQVVARRLVPPLRLRRAVEGVAVETGVPAFGAVTLTGVLLDDVRALEAQVERLTVH